MLKSKIDKNCNFISPLNNIPVESFDESVRPYNFILHQHTNEGMRDQAQMDAKSTWSPTWQQKDNDSWPIELCC